MPLLLPPRHYNFLWITVSGGITQTKFNREKKKRIIAVITSNRTPLAKSLECEAKVINQLHHVPPIILDTQCSPVRSSALLKLQSVSMRPSSPVPPMCAARTAEAPRSSIRVVKEKQLQISASLWTVSVQHYRKCSIATETTANSHRYAKSGHKSHYDGAAAHK